MSKTPSDQHVKAEILISHIINAHACLFTLCIFWVMLDQFITVFWIWYTRTLASIPEVVSTCCVIGLSLYVVNVYGSVVGQPRRRLWWILIQNNDSKPRRSCYHIQMVLYQHKTTSSFEIYLKLYRWNFHIL